MVVFHYKKIIMSAVVLMAIGSVFLVMNYLSDVSSKAGGIVPSAGAKAVSMGAQDIRGQFDRWAMSQDRPDTLEEARGMLPKNVLLPTEAGALSGIFVSKGRTPGQEEATFLYGDVVEGIKVLVRFGPPIDYASVISEFEENKKKGILKSDTVPESITIRGHQGYGMAPGYNLIQGDKKPRPGFVDWQEDGVQYTVSGARGITADATSLDSLTKIANSFR